MKTANLEGPALEYWFAKATGKCDVGGDYEGSSLSDWISMNIQVFFWWDIGPIMERERISPIWNDIADCWFARSKGRDTAPEYAGKTALIAVMRCVVSSKFGEEVPDEVETEKAA